MLKYLFSYLFLAHTVHAQEAPALSTTSPEVVVTGSKFPRLAAESAQNITVIDSATIARSVDIGQLLNDQAGIVVNGAYSNPGKDKSIFLRNGANQYTLILVDGQPLIDPSSLGGAVDIRLLSLDGIQRIEILRGARSVLYGSDAVAGVINLITTGGGTAPDPFTLHLRAAAQRYNTYEGSVNISGRTKKLDYRIGYDRFTTQGLSEARAPDSSQVEFAKDGAERQTFTASVAYRPNERWTIRPALRRALFAGDYDGGSFLDADNNYNNKLWLPSLAIDYRKENISFGARYNYVSTDRVFNSSFGEDSFIGRAQQGDVYATYRVNERIDFSAGTQLRKERLKRDGLDLDDLSANNISPYVQLNWRLAKTAVAEAGYRYNDHSAFGGQGNFSLALATGLGGKWSGRISYGSAFQSPTLDQLGGPFGANPELQPQLSTSLELGVQLMDKDRKYHFGVTGFQRNIEDLIVYDFVAGYVNRDRLRDRGVEIEAAAPLNDRLGLNANLTYVRGRLSSTDPQGGTVETEEFFRRPRATAFLGITYSAKSSFLARLSGSYTGERPDVFFDASFSRFETRLDAYLMVNAYAEYRLGKARRVTLFAEVKNLTNTNFVEVTGFSTIGVLPRLGAAVVL